ncbi:MAG: response regulator transcription factor [Christensenellaceae bacterium]|nr:response regulator transcription factor [Christensenellaceae bacterium]
MKLLVAEDDRRMAGALKELLKEEGYDLDLAYDGEEALDFLMADMYDLVILDVMMPKKDGFSVVRRMRQEGMRTPVLMLTAKGEVDDKVTGLDSGADDYMVKPFLSKELLARVRALIRRNIGSPDGSLAFGDITLDTSKALLSCVTTGESVRLSEKEMKILEHMIANQGQIVSRESLAMRIWGFENDAEYNNVEVYMTFTRKKLRFIGALTEIKAVRGMGYELRCENV